MPLPTFFIIGAPRCGSTSLYHYLSLHPEISMSRIKEPHFFADNIRPPAIRVDDLVAYEGLFESDTKVRGEASPSYACYAQHTGAPERISALLPHAKFIYLVRDPIERTVSHYLHCVAMATERRPLADALDDLDDSAHPYTCPSCYGTQLERYLRYFPLSNVLVIDQADLLGDRARVLSDVFAFLGVDEAFASPEFDHKLGASGDRRRYSLRYLSFAERAAASPLRLLAPRTRRSLRAAVERLMFAPLPNVSLDQVLRHRLEQLYAPEASRLRELTAKAFSTWSV